MVLLTALADAVQQFYCGVVPQVPDGVVFRRSVLKRALSKQARMELIVSDSGLAHRDADGDLHFLAWTDVEAVVPDDEGGGFAVIGRNLCLFPVFPDLFGKAACAAVAARIPSSRWLTRPAPASSRSAQVPVG